VVSTVDLKSAANYAILAKTGISTVPTSAIRGDIAVSPIDAAAITGFGLILDSAGEFSKSDQFTGKAWAADYTSPTPATLSTAILDMEAAYNNAAGRVATDAIRIDFEDGLLGGKTLTAGLYTWNTNVLITADMYLSGFPNAIFICQSTGDVVVDSAVKVILQGGVEASTIFWQVAGKVTAGTTSHFEGILLVKTIVAFLTGSSLNGRILAQTGVTLQSTTITPP
jgi:hypothetical protein